MQVLSKRNQHIVHDSHLLVDDPMQRLMHWCWLSCPAVVTIIKHFRTKIMSCHIFGIKVWKYQRLFNVLFVRPLDVQRLKLMLRNVGNLSGGGSRCASDVDDWIDVVLSYLVLQCYICQRLDQDCFQVYSVWKFDNNEIWDGVEGGQMCLWWLDRCCIVIDGIAMLYLPKFNSRFFPGLFSLKVW